MKNPSQLQMDILERAVGARKLEELLQEYNGAKKKQGPLGMDRAAYFEEPVTKENLEEVEYFFDTLDESQESVAKSLGYDSGSQLRNNILKTLIRWAYQNSEKILGK
jgi:hypothetical protein